MKSFEHFALPIAMIVSDFSMLTQKKIELECSNDMSFLHTCSYPERQIIRLLVVLCVESLVSRLNLTTLLILCVCK